METNNKQVGNPVKKPDEKKKLVIVRSPESIAEQKQYSLELVAIVSKFRAGKIAMNKTSLQKYAVRFVMKDEGTKKSFVEYVNSKRAGEKVVL